MALDRPASPPDRPEAPAARADPPAPEAPHDPWGVESLTRAQAFESLRAKVAGQDSSEPSADEPDRRGSYWAEVSRFQSVWEGIKERFPAEQKSLEGAANDSRSTVSAELRLALDQISNCEPPVSADMRSIEAGAQSGGYLVGFEFRMKSIDRLGEKVAERIRREPERDPARILGTMHDAIRYTFCIPKDSYIAGCEEIKGKLESCGYEMYHRRNSWPNPEYKGLNTRWITPGGQRFEVQFHTEESFHAKHDVTHGAYERLRRPGVSTVERRELMNFQKLVSSRVPVPDGAENISDFDKDA